jgi:hypothetical protein
MFARQQLQTAAEEQSFLCDLAEKLQAGELVSGSQLS